MPPELYIWIPRWKDFQHYKPDRERGPAWIKTHTAQLSDGRYLDLTDRQRALLHDVRMLFASWRLRLPYDARMLAKQRNVRTRYEDLEALISAGSIEVCSRETLDQRLELFYALPRAEVEKRREETPSHPNLVVPTPGESDEEHDVAAAFPSREAVAAEPDPSPDFNGLSRLEDEPARILAAAARRNLDDEPL